MFQKRSFPAFVLMASLGAAATVAVFAPTPVSAGAYCDTMKNAKVKKACADAGISDEKGLKKQMKDWQDKAKDNGGDYKCTTCHVKNTGGEKKPEADSKWDDFAKKAGI